MQTGKFSQKKFHSGGGYVMSKDNLVASLFKVFKQTSGFSSGQS
jgi:hypothetical protein